MVKVSPAVFKGLEAVRRSGRTNMLDWQAVRRIAGELGYAETSRWVMNHRKHYAEGIFQGFEPIVNDGEGSE